MTTVDGAYDFEYKIGEVDLALVQLKENGSPIDLSTPGTSVVFNMAISGNPGSRKTLTCTTGAVLNGQVLAASDGWITMEVTAAATAINGLYRGEFVITIGTEIAKNPSGFVYELFKVNDAI
jgi:hypothetical protein